MQTGITPLGIAVFTGKTDTVRFLIDHGANINHQNNVEFLQCVLLQTNYCIQFHSMVGRLYI